MQATRPLQTTRRQHGIMPPQSGPEMQMLAHQSAVFSDSCCLPPPPPSYTRSGGSGSDTSSSRLPGIQLDVVKRPAADAGVRPSSAAGGFTPLAAVM